MTHFPFSIFQHYMFPFSIAQFMISFLQKIYVIQLYQKMIKKNHITFYRQCGIIKNDVNAVQTFWWKEITYVMFASFQKEEVAKVFVAE